MNAIRVVIADDSADIRRMLRLSLELEDDFEVIGEAGDGRAATELVVAERPDAILLDLAMPVMDGLQAIPAIRECSPMTRIVVLSGFHAGEMAAQARSLGADAYLEKGTAFRDVVALLRSMRDREPQHAAATGAAAANPSEDGAAAAEQPGASATTAGPTSLAATVAGAPDLESALDLLTLAAGGIAPLERASFGVVTEDASTITVLASTGTGGWRLPAGSSIALDAEGRDILGQGRSWTVSDTSARPDLPGVSELADRGIRSFVTIPIVVGQRLRSLVSFASLRPGQLGPGAAAELEELIEPVGVVLHVLGLLDDERDAVQRMRDLDRLRSDFVGMVAHDLRSPLTVISGFAEGLERGWESLDDELKRDFLARISRNVGTLTALVEDVLTVSHIQSREFQLDVRPLDLGALILDCVAELTEAHPSRTIVAHVAPDLPAVHGDRVRQRQVVCNLIGNALKFSPDEAPVEVTARAASADAVEVSVADHGIGIEADDVPRLFERFYRTDAGREHDRTGTGLGLFICKSLVESWGGEIRVDSTFGAGSVFTYTTPIAVEERLHAPARAQGTASSSEVFVSG